VRQNARCARTTRVTLRRARRGEAIALWQCLPPWGARTPPPPSLSVAKQSWSRRGQAPHEARGLAAAGLARDAQGGNPDNDRLPAHAQGGNPPHCHARRARACQGGARAHRTASRPSSGCAPCTPTTCSRRATRPSPRSMSMIGKFVGQLRIVLFRKSRKGRLSTLHQCYRKKRE